MRAQPAGLRKRMRCYLEHSCFTPATSHRGGAVNWKKKEKSSKLHWSWGCLETRWPSGDYQPSYCLCQGRDTCRSGLVLSFSVRTLFFTFVPYFPKKRSILPCFFVNIFSTQKNTLEWTPFAEFHSSFWYSFFYWKKNPANFSLHVIMEEGHHGWVKFKNNPKFSFYSIVWEKHMTKIVQK